LNFFASLIKNCSNILDPYFRTYESLTGSIALPNTGTVPRNPSWVPDRLVPLYEKGIALLGDAGECEGSTELDLAQNHQGLVLLTPALPDRLVPLHENGIALLRDARESEGSAELDLAQHQNGLVQVTPALT
jgi:hypothetical protein